MTRRDLVVFGDLITERFQRMLLAHVPSPSPSPSPRRRGRGVSGEEENYADTEDRLEDDNNNNSDDDDARSGSNSRNAHQRGNTPIRKKCAVAHRDPTYTVFQVSRLICLLQGDFLNHYT